MHSDTISRILLARFVSSSSTVSMLTSSVLLWLVFRLAGDKDLKCDTIVTVLQLVRRKLTLILETQDLDSSK